MNSKEQERKLTLDHMIDEKFGEIYFLAKEEFDIENNSAEEQKLYDLLNKFKDNLKQRCKAHFLPSMVASQTERAVNEFYKSYSADE
jgi:hypothetical protein|tara:strand:+ start:305 stop:565 length:261 start_codon:yes stop_codon:yes gene_type:complete